MVNYTSAEDLTPEEEAAENEGIIMQPVYSARRADLKGRKAYEQMESLAQRYGLTPKDFDNYFFHVPDSMRTIFKNIISDFRRDCKKDVGGPEFVKYASMVMETYRRNIDEISRFDDKF